MAEKQLEIHPIFSPLFDPNEKRRYRQVYGGRGSGKSFAVSIAKVAKVCRSEHRKILFLRQTMTSSEDSTYSDVVEAMRILGVAGDFTQRGGDFTHRKTGNKILFKGIRATGAQSAKLKSLSGVTDLVIEEAEEVESFEEFSKVDESIRMAGIDLTVTLVYNPTSAIKSWIHKEWFVNGQPNPKRMHDTVYLHSTYKDNLDNLNPKVIQRYDDLALSNPTYYKNNILAEWTLEVANRVYEGWSEYPSFEDRGEVWYGLDFGYGGNDKTSLIEVNLYDNRYYVREVFSQNKLSISDTIQIMKRLGIPYGAVIIADSAVPTLITEIRRAGFRKIRKAIKGSKSKEQGIKKVQDMDIVLVGDNPNLFYAYNTFSYDAKGELPHEPDELASLRYALTHPRTTVGGRVIRSGRY